jgi:hypothetical protein
MTPDTLRTHLESVTPGLWIDALERAAIRWADGQAWDAALAAAYVETCRRVGVEPVT